jgi:hypothetical protein
MTSEEVRVIERAAMTDFVAGRDPKAAQTGSSWSSACRAGSS